jgi:hypothetical protein
MEVSTAYDVRPQLGALFGFGRIRSCATVNVPQDWSVPLRFHPVKRHMLSFGIAVATRYTTLYDTFHHDKLASRLLLEMCQTLRLCHLRCNPTE